MSKMKEIAQALQEGNADRVKELTQAELDGGTPAKTILEKGLVAGMNVIGARFKEGEIFLPEVLLSARAMNQALEIIEPHLGADEDGGSRETVVLGTVQGDLHDIGKNIVAIMLRGAGYRVVDLGADVSIQTFVKAVEEHRPKALGLSALLTTTMLVMGDVIEALKQAGLREVTKVLVGGAPLTQSYADEIGADGFSENAYGAVALIKD